ncbi:hypothetical protein G6F56_005641 [Rhizopus delemar]|uniref:SH3 domain-containing protein n=1 Tax=Rhizopus stolonifer TaxID=4846 RepID=A0A367JV61_RHIST|nr:hypothetical protein G6F56_005641 [Rhizopus delemar]RCH93816.1 hypothetical protein CU098_006632 [Rhizopus stolonifer]
MHWAFTLTAYVALSEAKPYLWMKRQQLSTPPYVTSLLSYTTTGTATHTLSSLTIHTASSSTLLTTDSSTFFTTSSPTLYTAASSTSYTAASSMSYTVSSSTSYTVSSSTSYTVSSSTFYTVSSSTFYTAASNTPYTPAISTSYAAASSTLSTLESPSPYTGGSTSASPQASFDITDTRLIPMIVGIVLALVFIIMIAFFFIRYKRKHAVVNNRPVTQHKIGIIAATFTPTLYDEMDVQIGDQVRVLLEFDDGWCQGINLNNNTMGVFPRHCLEGVLFD